MEVKPAVKPVKPENGNTNNAQESSNNNNNQVENRGPKKFERNQNQGGQNHQNKGGNQNRGGPNKFGGNQMNRGNDRDRNNKGGNFQNRNMGPKNDVSDFFSKWRRKHAFSLYCIGFFKNRFRTLLWFGKVISLQLFLMDLFIKSKKCTKVSF